MLFLPLSPQNFYNIAKQTILLSSCTSNANNRERKVKNFLEICAKKELIGKARLRKKKPAGLLADKKQWV